MDHNDVVTVGNQTSILQKVMSAQWESKADAKVSYHELKLTEDAAQPFTLTNTHAIGFRLHAVKINTFQMGNHSKTAQHVISF